MTPGIATPGAAWRTRAVLVEVEGVLLDTAAGTEATWHWWSHRVGLDGDELAEAARGRTVTDVVTESLTGHTAELDIEEQVSHVEDRLALLLRSATRRRGAGSLLRALPPGRVAIVSSWRGAHLDAAVRRAQIHRPAVVISADDVPTGRPDPTGISRLHERWGSSLPTAPRSSTPPSASPPVLRRVCGPSASRRGWRPST